MTYQKLKWEAKEIRSTFEVISLFLYFCYILFSFRWKSDINFLQVSRIPGTYSYLFVYFAIGKKICRFVSGWKFNSSLAIILGLRFSIYMKRESLFTYMPFTTYLFHISFPCILRDTCIWSRCVHTEQYTSLRSYTGECNTESARLCDIINVCAIASKVLFSQITRIIIRQELSVL